MHRETNTGNFIKLLENYEIIVHINYHMERIICVNTLLMYRITQYINFKNPLRSNIECNLDYNVYNLLQ